LRLFDTVLKGNTEAGRMFEDYLSIVCNLDLFFLYLQDIPNSTTYDTKVLEGVLLRAIEEQNLDYN